jgi:ribonuclease J
MNWISHTIIDYLTKTSTDPLLPEILEFHEAFKMVPKKRQSDDQEIQYKRATKNDYKKQERERQIKVMAIGKPYSFKSKSGEIKITQYLMDHSIPGACAYIIEYDGRSIIYTGDYRMHGNHLEWVNHFIEQAHKSNPVALITEGTRVSNIEDFRNEAYRSEDQSEDDVRIRSRDMIRRHPELIVVNFPARNLDRCLLYYDLARRYDRTFAITPRMYLYLESFKARLENMEEEVIKNFYNDYNIPPFDDESLVIYLPRKGWGKFEPQDYRTHERVIFDNFKYVIYKDIQKEPDKYLLYLDFFLLGELVDLDQKPNTVMYIYSTTDPFNEEMELQDNKLNAWLERFGILRTETIHSSGHCNMDHLIDAVQKIDADYIIPIHTEHPETFEEFGFSGKILQPKFAEKYVF